MDPQRIFILDIQAGGGHKAASQSLARALSKLGLNYFEHIELQSYAAEELHIKMTNTWILQKIYHLGHRLSSSKLAFHLLTRIPFMLAPKHIVNELTNELTPILEKNEPTKDTVFISTHLLITNTLLLLRKKLKLNFKIIVYVPDFDTSALHFPRINNEHADAVVAQANEFTTRITSNYNIPAITGGFIASNEFKCKTRISNVNEKEFHIVVVGGSQWVHFFKPTLQYLLKDREINHQNVHLHLINGTNKKSQEDFAKLQSRNQLRIHSHGFLDKAKLAQIFRKAHVVIMVSIAPATLYELINATAAPIIVHRTNPGQEVDTLNYALRGNLVGYVPKKKGLKMSLSKLKSTQTRSRQLRGKYLQEIQQAEKRLLAIKTLLEKL